LTYRKHLVGLVEDEHLHAVGLEETTLDHVVDTAGGTDDDLGAVLEGLHVITNGGTTNAGVALNVHEVTDGDNDLLDLLGKLTGGSKDKSLAGLEGGVDLLENGDRESGSLASTGLSLSNDIVAFGESQRELTIWSRIGVFLPLMTGMMARCWIAEGRSKP
jgi:hypothetical protein